MIVPLPDIKGREQILKVHFEKIVADKTVDLSVIARGTPGFSGADLANLVNESALLAGRVGKKKVQMVDFEKAKDKILMGRERRSLVMSDEEKKLVAFHEAGHAIVGLNLKYHDPIYKVSIIPRGMALGVTMFLPEKEFFNYSRQRLEDQITSMFGGRVAEVLEFGSEQATTGASNDIKRATDIARRMVTSWGLSKLGPITYGQEEGEIFLGRTVTSHKEVSPETASAIDGEVKRIIDENYKRAEEILEKNKDKLIAMADALLLYETLDKEDLDVIMSGEKLKKTQKKRSTRKLKKTEVKDKKKASSLKKESEDKTQEADTKVDE